MCIEIKRNLVPNLSKRDLYKWSRFQQIKLPNTSVSSVLFRYFIFLTGCVYRCRHNTVRQSGIYFWFNDIKENCLWPNTRHYQSCCEIHDSYGHTHQKRMWDIVDKGEIGSEMMYDIENDTAECSSAVDNGTTNYNPNKIMARRNKKNLQRKCFLCKWWTSALMGFVRFSWLPHKMLKKQ